MNSRDIVRFLQQKHHEDLVVSECKTGESGRDFQRFDLWVMAKSWAHPRTIGYEVKVDRGDFLNDKKWMGYLPFCNELWFACPRELIHKDEVPAECGLIWFSDKGVPSTRKKAPYRREGVDVESVYKYILMSRTKITAPVFKRDEFDPRQTADFWREWMEEKELKIAAGHIGSRNIRRRFEKEVLAVQDKQKRLEEQIARYADIRQMLEKLGLDPAGNAYTWVLEKKVRKAVGGLPVEHIDSLREISRSLSKKADELEKMNNELTDSSGTDGASAPAAS